MRVISWIRLEICPKFTSNQSRPGSRFRDDDCCHVGCGGWDPWRFRGVFFVCLQALGSWCLNGIYVLVLGSTGTKGHTLALCESFIWDHCFPKGWKEWASAFRCWPYTCVFFRENKEHELLSPSTPSHTWLNLCLKLIVHIDSKLWTMQYTSRYFDMHIYTQVHRMKHALAMFFLMCTLLFYFDELHNVPSLITWREIGADFAGSHIENIPKTCAVGRCSSWHLKFCWWCGEYVVSFSHDLERCMYIWWKWDLQEPVWRKRFKTQKHW